MPFPIAIIMLLALCGCAARDSWTGAKWLHHDWHEAKITEDERLKLRANKWCKANPGEC